MQPPGSSAARGSSSKKDDSQGVGAKDLKKVLMQGLAEGQTPPLMMMSMLLDKDKKEKRTKHGGRDSKDLSLFGGSDSEDSGGEDAFQGTGMRAVSTLHKLHEQIRRRPRKICEIFEHEVVQEMGVIKGQAWTLKDYVKKQPWGKFKGIYRCALMDVEVYEQLRNGEPQIAAAQVVQNLKAKLQSVLQGRDWSTAWLLTGLPDPLAKREWAGSKEEMAIISGYVDALHRLKKRVKDNQTVVEDDEGEGQGILPERGAGANIPLFPCTLPYPEAILTDGVSLDLEGCRRWFAKAFVNTFVAWGNFVTLGCPAEGGSGYEPRVAYLCREEARVMADELLGEVDEFVSEDLALGRLECDGKRGCIEALLEKIRCTGGACYTDLPSQVSGKTISTALPVSATRVAMPGQAGLVDPGDWLEPHRAEIFQDLARLRKPEHLWEDIAVACHRVPPEGEDDLARKLIAHGMAIAVPEHELPHDSRGQLHVGGLFCVAKNELEDRLIYDRRPENSKMHKLAWARLPSGACFTRMLLGEDEYLRGSGDDLRNYYYMLAIPHNWVKFNSVGRRMSRQVLDELGYDSKVDHRLCFRVLGMGDINGCDIAQATHESILRQHGVLDRSVQLVYGEPVPKGPLWEGAYLDDLLITLRCRVPGRVPLDGTFHAPAPQAGDGDVKQVAAAEHAYTKARLQRAEHKAFRFKTSFKAWGAHIDGIVGKVGVPLEVRRQVWMLLSKIVAGGWCNKDVLRRVLGFLAYIFQYRRELYCLQHHIYKYVQAMPDERWCRLPRHVLDELRSFALHLPFACWDMRRKLNSTLIATDATPTSGGSVACKMPAELAQELWRQSEVRGEAVRLDRGMGPDLSWDVPKEASVFASTIAESMDWRVTGSYSFRQTSHVNLQELRALRREIIRMARAPEHRNSIVVALNDSRVVCGCVAKGRSSSYKLNGMLRGLLPHLVMGKITISILWVETSSNYADHPSRFRDLPPPRSPPPWLQRFGVSTSASFSGVELSAGGTSITRAHVEAGLQMAQPVDIAYGVEALGPWIDQCIETGLIDWVWLAPSFAVQSRLQQSREGGRQSWARQGERRYDQEDSIDHLWWRLLNIAWSIMSSGGFFFLVHPRSSRVWNLAETQQLLNHEAVKAHRVDLCAHGGESSSGGSQGTSTILSNSP
ncbi:unnamed protein product [Symbiodinium sp. CCMP2592]|nr:unnamed protein product [Symbiodinium sp. CCMP2592]